MIRQTPQADEFKQQLLDSLQRETMNSRAIKIARHANVYTCSDQDEMVYFIESGQIELLMLSSEGKECLLAIHCEARRAQGDHRLTSPNSFTGSPSTKRKRPMAKNKVFVGYDYDHDKAFKDRLLGWDANQEFDFSSYDQSFGVAVDSPGAAAIKQDLAARIGDASYFLYIVGKESYRSGWTEWEVRKAVELKKRLVAAKTDSTNNSPASLQGVGASWSTMFNFDSIKQAIDRV